MLAPSIVKEIRRLLVNSDFSQRKISRMTGVSRGTISAIASGKRPDYEPRHQPEEEPFIGPPSRCPSCGSMVYMPCRACALRQKMAAKNKRRVSLRDVEDDLRLELRGKANSDTKKS